MIVPDERQNLVGEPLNLKQAVVLKYSTRSHNWRATLNSIKYGGLKWYLSLEMSDSTN